MKYTIIESPFAAPKGHWPRWWYLYQNRKYLRRCLRDSLLRGEAPFASHGIYPGALDDNSATERLLGMKAGWGWMKKADAVIFYLDRGTSSGMLAGLKRARELKLPVEQRWLDKPKMGNDILD